MQIYEAGSEANQQLHWQLKYCKHLLDISTYFSCLMSYKKNQYLFTKEVVDEEMLVKIMEVLTEMQVRRKTVFHMFQVHSLNKSYANLFKSLQFLIVELLKTMRF